MLDKTKVIFSTAFTLTGTIVGAGFLGLPYAFMKSGFFIGLFWLIFLGIILLLVDLYFGEITLRTRAIHQIPGYSKKYLGRFLGKVTSLSMIFGIYSALIAYLIGEGQSLSQLFFGNTNYSLPLTIFFLFFMAILSRGGIKKLRGVEFFGVLSVIISIVLISLIMYPNVKYENFSFINFSKFFFPFGIVLFSFLGFNSIPELRRELGRDTKMLKKAILIGAAIPIFLYIIFSFAVVGALGEKVSEIATLSFKGLFGKFLLLLGIFTMGTAFFSLSFALRDYLAFDLRKRELSFLCVYLIPFLLYSVFNFFGLFGFTKILGVGGAISGGITAIFILVMNIISKKEGDRRPEYSIPINWFVIFILGMVFLVGIISEIF